MLDYFVVFFREGLEIFLIIAIAIAFLKQTNQDHLLSTAYTSVFSAVIFSLIFGFILSQLGEMSPVWEGSLAFIAAALIISCTYEMVKLGPKMGCMIRDDINKLKGTKEKISKIALFGFIFLMIAREGIEVSAMIATLIRQTGTKSVFMGCSLGLLASVMLSLLWIKYGKKINLTLFFKASAIYLGLFSIQLLFLGIHEFSEVGILPFVDNNFVHAVTEPYGPEGEYAIIMTSVMLLLPMIYVGHHYFKNINNSLNK